MARQARKTAMAALTAYRIASRPPERFFCHPQGQTERQKNGISAIHNI